MFAFNLIHATAYLRCFCLNYCMVCSQEHLNAHKFKSIVKFMSEGINIRRSKSQCIYFVVCKLHCDQTRNCIVFIKCIHLYHLDEMVQQSIRFDKRNEIGCIYSLALAKI